MNSTEAAASRTDLHPGQWVEWHDLMLDGTNRGRVEHVSAVTPWVTVKLDCPYTMRARLDGPSSEPQRITHTTLWGPTLTPLD